MQLRYEARLPAEQLLGEHLPQQVVVAVPLAPAVERDDEQVAALELLQHPARPRALDGGVAKVSAQACEDGGPGEEGQLRPGELLEHLFAQVALDVAVVPGGATGDRAPRVGLDRQCGDVEGDGPPLGAVEQVAEGAGVRGGPRTAQQLPGLVRGHREVTHAEFQDVPLQAQAGQGQGQGEPRGHGDLPTRGQSQGDLGQHVVALAVRDRLDVVENQHRSWCLAPDCVHEPRDGGHSGALDQAFEPTRIDRPEALQRGSQAAHEHGGIVVALVARQPRAIGVLRRRPLREHGGLAVAGGRDHGDDRHGTGCSDRGQDARTWRDAGPGMGPLELGLPQADRKGTASSRRRRLRPPRRRPHHQRI